MPGLSKIGLPQQRRRGAGRARALGRALVEYGGFAECGINLAAGFDADPALSGISIGGRLVFPMSKLKNVCLRRNMRIGMIAVPAGAARSVCGGPAAAGDSGRLEFRAHPPLHAAGHSGAEREYGRFCGASLQPSAGEAL